MESFWLAIQLFSFCLTGITVQILLFSLTYMVHICVICVYMHNATAWCKVYKCNCIMQLHNATAWWAWCKEKLLQTRKMIFSEDLKVPVKNGQFWNPFDWQFNCSASVWLELQCKFYCSASPICVICAVQCSAMPVLWPVHNATASQCNGCAMAVQWPVKGPASVWLELQCNGSAIQCNPVQKGVDIIYNI